MKFTLSDIEKLQKSGKIRGYKISVHSKKGERKRHLKKVGKQKYWMEIVLGEWCKERGLELVPEFQFHPTRKWRFDWIITNESRTVKIAIEYEGIFSEHSRHTNKIGYSNDATKYREAVILGWQLLRYDARTYKGVITELNKLL